MINKKTVLAITLATGGSKGIPKKNIRPLLGKPLLIHSLDQARKSGLFDCIAAYRAEHVWLYASISLIGSTALFRSLAVVVHASDPLTMSIILEIVTTAVLVLCVYLMKMESTYKLQESDEVSEK